MATHGHSWPLYPFHLRWSYVENCVSRDVITGKVYILPLQTDLVKIMINDNKLVLNAQVVQSLRLNTSCRFLKPFGGKWRCR